MADAADNPPPQPPKPAGPPPMWMAAGGPAPVGRNKALLFGAFLIVLVLGALVGVLLLPEPPAAAYLVSLPLPFYEDPALPPVAWAEGDTQRLIDCFPPGNAENAINVQEAFDGKLRAISEGRLRAEWGDDDRRKLEKGRPFVFHVVGHAAADGDTVYLLPVKAEAADPKGGVALDRVLKAMRDCPTPKKLLLLDVGRPRTNAFQGVLADEVTPKLHAFLKKAALPCPVLVSCSPDEESHVSPPAGASAFAFYAAEGLSGAADGYADTLPDKRVKVRELAAFVQARVGRWAQLNRGRPQQPKLFLPPDFADFDLALDVPKPPTEDAEPPKKLPFAKAGTAAGWEQVAKLSAEELRRAGPAVAQWAAAAVRAEQIYAAGSEAKAAAAAAQAAAWLAKAEDAARRPASPEYPTLAAVPLPPETAAAAAALRAYGRAAVPDRGTKPDEKEKADRKKEFDDAAAKLPGPAVAKVAWDWLTKEYPQPQWDHVRLAGKVVADAVPNAAFAEAAALKWLTSLDAVVFNSAAGREAVAAFLKSEVQAVAALKPGAEQFAWVAKAVSDADQLQAAGEETLRAADTTKAMKAAEEKFAAAARAFEAVAAARTARTAARAAADDALRVCAATAWAAAEYNQPTDADWGKLQKAAAALAAKVYARPSGDGGAGLDGLTHDAATATADVLKPFAATAVKDLLDAAGSAGPQSLTAYRALLETGLPIADRGKVWDKAGEIAERLHTAARTEDLKDNDSGAKTKPTGGAAVADGRSRRADVAAGLLELAGAARPAADRLRDAWGPDARQKRIDELAARKEWDALDRFARVFPIGATAGRPDGAEWQAADRGRKEHDTAFQGWLDARPRQRR